MPPRVYNQHRRRLQQTPLKVKQKKTVLKFRNEQFDHFLFKFGNAAANAAAAAQAAASASNYGSSKGGYGGGSAYGK